jgi:hypothetical protein
LVGLAKGFWVSRNMAPDRPVRQHAGAHGCNWPERSKGWRTKAPRSVCGCALAISTRRTRCEKVRSRWTTSGDCLFFLKLCSSK